MQNSNFTFEYFSVDHDINVCIYSISFGTGTERRQQMLPLAMPNVTNPSSNWAQRNEALNNSSQQLMNATSEANNQKELKRRTTDENIAVQPPEVHKLETTLGWIESELMDDRLEISDDDSFLIDLEVYKHNLWMLAFN